jgi:hypothetical protein
MPDGMPMNGDGIHTMANDQTMFGSEMDKSDSALGREFALVKA